MEQILTVASSITTIFGALISIVGLVVVVYIVVLCVKFNRLMQQVTSTATSIKELSQLPMVVVSSLLQKLLGSNK